LDEIQIRDHELIARMKEIVQLRWRWRRQKQPRAILPSALSAYLDAVDSHNDKEPRN